MTQENREIYCCQCLEKVSARLTTGLEIYPHRPDLQSLPFWKCDVCKNYVGCHHKTSNRTQPLGNIPTKQLKEARKHIHKILDPLWKSKKLKRSAIYKQLSDALGWEYHTAKLKNIEEARVVYGLVKQIAKESI